jgi:queuine tRNA-ribosyltransferase
MNWDYNLLTDSGGFQMVSLSDLTVVTEEGVEFTSHIKGDDRRIMLTPEKSIQIQNKLGSDIIMALDDVIPPTSSEGDLHKSCERTLRWLDRCIEAHSRKSEQNLFGIVQGGLDLELRKYCTEEMIKKDLPGYAIGGLAGGEGKEDFWKVVNQCTNYLPKDKPRYLMGVGYPVDLVVCALLGVDMFDCVFATRTARFGTAFTNKGFLKLKNEKNKFDFKPIEPDCDCEVCQKYNRSYFYMTINKNARSLNMISFHNVYFLLNLMKRLRTSIMENKVNEFVQKFIEEQFIHEKEYPEWVYCALKQAGVNTEFMEMHMKNYN